MALDLDKAEIEGVSIRVVTAEQLHEMKRDTVRPKDRIDAEALRRLKQLEKE